MYGKVKLASLLTDFHQFPTLGVDGYIVTCPKSPAYSDVNICVLSFCNISKKDWENSAIMLAKNQGSKCKNLLHMNDNGLLHWSMYTLV